MTALLELVTGVRPRIVEHFEWDRPQLPPEQAALYRRLYGAGADNVCILLDASREKGENPVPEPELERLVEDSCMLGVQCRVVRLRKCSRTDTYCYLDVNSALSEPETIRTDSALLGGHITAG